MAKKTMFLMIIGIFLFTSPSFAKTKQDYCKDFYKLYKSCFNLGQQKKNVKACEEAGDKLEEELMNEAEGIKEEGFASFLATVCDAACQTAVKDEGLPSYDEFKNEFCK